MFKTYSDAKQRAGNFRTSSIMNGLLVLSALLTFHCVAFPQTLTATESASPADSSMTPHGEHHASVRLPAVASRGVNNEPGKLTIGSTQVAFPDLVVVDQHGARHRFYSDLIKNKTVILTFFYTSCINVCPAMGLTLSKLQSQLGERLGRDVFIVSVTKDPATDTPRRLTAWGKQFGVKPGWTMVTGNMATIEQIVRDFTGNRLGRDSHNGVFFIGNDRNGFWLDGADYTGIKVLTASLEVVNSVSN